MRRFSSLALVFVFMILCSGHDVRAAALDVQEIRTKSGVTAWLVADNKLPLIALSFAFRGGVEQDPQDRQGLAMLATSLLDQGAGNLDAEAFQDALAQDAIQLNFAAGRDQIGGALKTRRATKDRAFDLLRLALMTPRFDAPALRLAQDQQKARLRQSLADPEWQARRALFDVLFPDHPYALRALGTVASVESITQADLTAWRSHHFAKSNLIIGVTGAISAQELTQALDRIFGSLPPEPSLTMIPPTVAKGEGASRLVPRKGTQTDMVFALPAPLRRDPDWQALEIANYILGGGGFSSRLMKELRNKHGLTYGVSTALAPMAQAGLIVGHVAADNDKIAKAQEKMMEVWADFYKNGPTIQEIDAAKAYLTGALPLALTATDKIASFLVYLQREGLDKTYLDTQKEAMEKVTIEDVRRVIKTHFAPTALRAAFAGQPENLYNSLTVQQAEE